MARPIRCPKCGLMQMARGQCKKCGTPFETAPGPPMPNRQAQVEQSVGGSVAVAAPPVPATDFAPPPPPEATEPPAAPLPAPVVTPPEAAPIEPMSANAPAVNEAQATPAPAAMGESPFEVQPAERYDEPLDPVFNRDRFLLRQKVLTIHEKYEVWDEEGEPIVYVERPGRHLRNFGALLGGVAAAGGVGTAGYFATSAISDSPAAPVVMGIFALLAFVVLFVVATALSAKRHLYFYRDPDKSELLFEVLQDQKFVLFVHTYTLMVGNIQIAKFSKNILTDVFRKQWKCFDGTGQLICVAKEDSLLKALVRRFLTRLLPLNFVFYAGQGEQVIGQFDRKFTLLDRYVLDMSLDVGGVLDRRVALALGVMLDTGERR